MAESSAQLVPVHLGIIPDGNRRWAKANGLTSLEGHQRGAEIMEEICEAAYDRGVRYVTMYAFSAENWDRPPTEIKYLMKLFERMVTQYLKKLEKKGIRIRSMGRQDKLPAGLVNAVAKAEARTAKNTRGTLAICLNYGGLQELADATTSLEASDEPKPYTPKQLQAHLYAPDIPLVDLIIRTSGEQRTSGFMLGRADYAELYFVEKHWPDFTVADLQVALDDYAHRQRRFGA